MFNGGVQKKEIGRHIPTCTHTPKVATEGARSGTKVGKGWLLQTQPSYIFVP